MTDEKSIEEQLRERLNSDSPPPTWMLREAIAEIRRLREDAAFAAVCEKANDLLRAQLPAETARRESAESALEAYLIGETGASAVAEAHFARYVSTGSGGSGASEG